MEEPHIICRDCFKISFATKFCPSCRSPRTIQHSELFNLSIAHIDCDAFYASVEKRDDPNLMNKPIIVGGGKRGVVTTCCYISRIKGVRSAMPIFKAKKLCPEAVIISPRMSVYQEVSKDMMNIMLDFTPMVEPISVDEAFLDLSGTTRLHKLSPSEILLRIIKKIENELNITVSAGLSHNKFLAKLASAHQKPRGFMIIGKEETQGFLEKLDVAKISGIGPALQTKLKTEGISKIAQLKNVKQSLLEKRYGSIGRKIWNLAHGIDIRPINPQKTRKSISSETTFGKNIDKLACLRKTLWELSEKVSYQLKEKKLTANSLTIKLKTANFQQITITQSSKVPVKFAEELFLMSLKLLSKKIDFKPFRLIGLGVSKLQIDNNETLMSDLFPHSDKRKVNLELALDKIRAKYGKKSIKKGVNKN